MFPSWKELKKQSTSNKHIVTMLGRSIKYLNEIISNIEFFFNTIAYKMTISILKYIKLYLKIYHQTPKLLVQMAV